MSLTAFCNSIKCTNGKSMKPVKKDNAKRGDLECPDCKNILIWRKDGVQFRHFAKNRGTKSNKSTIFDL